MEVLHHRLGHSEEEATRNLKCNQRLNFIKDHKEHHNLRSLSANRRIGMTIYILKTL
jgi:hypothetical protein